MILITGATGNIGVELVRKLSTAGHTVRAFIRSRRHAKKVTLPGVEFAEGDFTEPQTFPPSLVRIDRLFLLIPSSAGVEQQQLNFVDAAKRSGVRHIVKLSQFDADENAPGRFQRYHGAVEKYILKSGIPFTFLRPNLFMQGLLILKSTISSQGAFYAPAGNAKVSLVDVRDIASVAAKVLTEQGHQGKTYDITGPEALTHAEMADHLSKAVGKTIHFVDIPPEAMRQALLAFGMPRWQTDGLVEDYDHYRRGEAATVSSTVRDLTGSEPISFRRFAKDYAREFQSHAASTA